MADSGIPGDFPSLTLLREMEDGELVRLMVRGYSEAMTVVFDRHYPLMMLFAVGPSLYPAMEQPDEVGFFLTQVPRVSINI